MLIKVHYGHNAYKLILVDSVRGSALNYFSFWRATSKAPGTDEVNVFLCVFFPHLAGGQKYWVQGKAFVFTRVETAALASTSFYNILNDNAGDQWKDQDFPQWTGS